ncbi:glycosyltransferase family 4 protein [Cryobacterium sp. TMT2-23]|uniref:glycosyltransferase family 4 protein n=1 Tax=Cryobacterium sp. TMT2-23 TaxID=1259252 RepID=UPI00141A91D3|nr:glycosyltransferase family 4 protein [Cryobacterium sp. TMT2-23]
MGVGKIFAAPFTVDISRFANATEQTTAEERIALKSSVNIPTDRPIAVFSGKLTEGKRPLDFADAILLTKSGVHGVFIGDGAEMDALKNHPAHARMTILGFRNQQELPSLLSCGDILVLPSSYEAWGLAVNEGLACGLVPVVSDSVGCAPDLVAGVGVVFPTGDVPALADALDAASEISEGDGFRVARQAFMESYSVSASAQAYDSTIRAILWSKGSRGGHGSSGPKE